MIAPTLKSLLDSYEARTATTPLGPAAPLVDLDDDPEPITLTWIPPRRGFGPVVGWILLGLAVGLMSGWTAFL